MAFDLQVFNQQTYTSMTETIDQEVDKFNEASAGTIRLINRPTRGDFDQNAMFKAISGLVRRRDVYSNADVAPTNLEQMVLNAVKVAAGTTPTVWTPAHYEWVRLNPELAAYEIGRQLGLGRMQDMLNVGIGCAVAAIGGNAKVVTDLSTEPASYRGLNRGASKFGDRAPAIRAWVMHSSTVHTLYDNALANQERLFSYGDVNVYRDPWGRLLVITDSPDLIEAEGVYSTLGLVEDAVNVHGNDDFNAVLVPTAGKENILNTYQSEWSYNVGIKGYSWDTSKAKSPTNAQLRTAANWKKEATFDKETAGVLIKMGDIDTVAPTPPSGED